MLAATTEIPRAKIELNLKNERNNFIRKPLTNLITLQEKNDFPVSIVKRCTAFNKEENISTKEISENFKQNPKRSCI